MHLVVGRMVQSRAGGFSLIEILIVVALVGTLAAATAPMVAAGLERYTILSAGQQVASTVRAARFQAVARNRGVRVLFDSPADGQYETEVWNPDTSAWDPLGEAQALPGDVTFGDGTDDIEVTTEGRVVAASTITVTNGNADDDRTVTVSQSGRVELD